MSYVLCDISAFRFHRVPPQVLALCPPVPSPETDRRRRALRGCPLASEVLGLPLHVLVGSRDMLGSRALERRHLWGGEVPIGGIWDTEMGVRVTSPLLTLLSLASRVNEVHLLMAVYEFCGSFSVFRPSAAVEMELKRAFASGALGSSDGWRRVPGSGGRPSSLWVRDPLISIDELRRFATEHIGDRGGRKLFDAAQKVTGVAASPLEVQASILFSLSRRKGGEGLDCFENNYRISMNHSAQRIAEQQKAYADLHFVSADGLRSVIVECQGLSVHGETGVSGRDADRATALQSMGYDVVMLTRGQLADPGRFAAVATMLRKRLGYPEYPKTEAMKRREVDLRANLFIDWETLGE